MTRPKLLKTSANPDPFLSGVGVQETGVRGQESGDFRSSNRIRAFALVEILVVAIIGILDGLIVGLASRARAETFESGRRSGD